MTMTSSNFPKVLNFREVESKNNKLVKISKLLLDNVSYHTEQEK
jgi:hypothetical protein